MKINDALANDVLDGIDATFNGGTFEVRTGAAGDANGAATGTVLASFTIPADAFGPASARVKGKLGTWSDLAGDAAGTIGHVRMVNAAGTRVALFTASVSAGGGEVEFSSLNVLVGGPVEVTAFSLGLGPLNNAA